jgi:hypothetical protein
MLKQIKAPKTSSATRAVLNQAARAYSAQEYWKLVQGTENKAVIEELLNRHLFERRKELLSDLANMHDRGFARFLRKWGQRFLGSHATLTDGDIFTLRDGLRQVWHPEVSIAEKQGVLNGWLQVRHPIPSSPRGPFSYIGQRPLQYDMWQPVLHAGKIEPAFHSIRAQLIQGVLEQHPRLAICLNPDCAAPYFMAKRSDQKYCERGECTAYAQRKYALEWWNREGKESRRRKVKRKPRISKRRRK